MISLRSRRTRTNDDHPVKITLGEMREFGVRDVLL